MFIKDNKRWSKPYSKGTTEIDGVRYPNTVWDKPEFLAAQGVTEIPDPQLPEGVTDETHYITTLNEAPWLQWTPKSEEQIQQTKNGKLQAQIDSEERSTMLPRVTREFMLAAFVASLPEGTDPMTNIGYKRMKELDDKIKALRQQIITIPAPEVAP